MYPTQPNKPAPSFGVLQQNFVYNLRNFRTNDQFTIIEDLPANKPIRQKSKMSLKPNQRTGKPEPYTVFAIRISSGGFEADLELFETELNTLAIACPKDTKNFKGVTLAFDGFKWQYVCGDMPVVGTDPRQPNLYAPNEQRPPAPPAQPAVDQQTIFIQRLAGSITALNAIGTDVTSGDMIKIADKITPGDALGLIAAAKMAGYIVESNGVFKVA